MAEIDTRSARPRRVARPGLRSLESSIDNDLPCPESSRCPRLSPDYTDRDRCAIDQGSIFTLGRVLPEFLQVDYKNVHAFPIPVIMFMGRHDYTTPSEPTAAWVEQVRAPFKQGVWFEHSAHMVPWEEPGKLLVSLLQYVRPLATGEARPANERLAASSSRKKPRR